MTNVKVWVVFEIITETTTKKSIVFKRKSMTFVFNIGDFFIQKYDDN